MALLDILTGQQSSSGRVPPLAMALAGLLTYRKLKKPSGEGAAPADGPSVAERLEDFFKPSPSGGPTAKGVIGALLTGGLMDLVQQFRGAGGFPLGITLKELDHRGSDAPKPRSGP